MYLSLEWAGDTQKFQKTALHISYHVAAVSAGVLTSISNDETNRRKDYSTLVTRFVGAAGAVVPVPFVRGCG
jgi:hypothetical protein